MKSSVTYVDVYFACPAKGGNDVTVTHTPSPIVSASDYFAFGLQHTTGERAGVYEQRHLYNGKELQDELSLNTIDFGWRQYDPAIARWNVVDPLADRRHWMTPFNYVQNNPLSRFDPNGLTDFTLNKKKGEVKEVVYKDEKKQARNKAAATDRIVKTKNKTGEVKENRKGEAKTAVGDIAKGILEDGHNFKTQDKVINVNAEGQPTLAQVEDFLTKVSEYIGVEMSGAYLSKEANKDAKISKVYIDEYNGNESQKSFTSLTLLATDPKLSGYHPITHFHTHLTNINVSRDNIEQPSGRTPGERGDLHLRDKRRDFYHNFLILTRTASYPTEVQHIWYTEWKR